LAVKGKQRGNVDYISTLPASISDNIWLFYKSKPSSAQATCTLSASSVSMQEVRREKIIKILKITERWIILKKISLRIFPDCPIRMKSLFSQIHSKLFSLYNTYITVTLKRGGSLHVHQPCPARL